LLVPPDGQKHGPRDSEPAEPAVQPASTIERMRQKLRSEPGRALYKMRKAIVEPVFGQIKGVRGLRRFLLRGLDKVRDEFKLIAMTHNLLKLFRHGRVARALPSPA
jgi:hypothetical protein